MLKRNNPKIVFAKARNLSAGLNRLIGQSKLMSLYATFDEQTDKELKQSRKIGAHRMRKQQTRKRQIVPTEPKGFNKSAPMAPQSGRKDVMPWRQDSLGLGASRLAVKKERVRIGDDVFYVNMQGIPA